MKRQWIEKEISNFRGIATAKATPELNECSICKNLDLRENTGELVMRPGYAQKYAAPTHASLTSPTYLAFENFFIPDIGYDATTEENGKEVTCQVVKGTANPVSGSGVSTTKNILAFFIRPYVKKLTSGSVKAGSTKKLISVDGFTATTNQYKNCYLLISVTTAIGDVLGQYRKIISHTTGISTTIVFTIEELESTPATADTFEIYGWSDTWHWLNEMVITKITGVVGGDQNRLEIYKGSAALNDYAFWTIYNITKSEFSLITYNAASVSTTTEICVTDANNSWDPDDEIILCPNWIPLQYLEQMYNVAASDIVFHRLINDLRIGFGGQRDRLGVSVGLRVKNFDLDYEGSHPSIAGQFAAETLGSMCKIVLDPYNCTAESGWIASTAVLGTTGSATLFPNKRYYYYTVVMLDDQSWQVVENGYVTPNGTTERFITFKIKMLLGLMNKRITYGAVFLSEGSGAASDEMTNPFVLVGEKRITTFDFDDTIDNDFNADGFIEVAQIDIYYQNFLDNGGEMQEVLGFVPTMTYVKSWDASLATDSKVYIVNPYSDQRWENKVFFSPISGDGVFQYDTLVGSKYQDFSNVFNEGNEVVGLGLLANLDIGVLKKNSFEKRDAETGTSYYSGVGLGSTARRSIVRAGELLFWCSERDIYAHDGQQIINVSEATIRDVYRALSNNQRNAIFATKEEKDNAYRFFVGGSEYVLTKRGWVKHDRYLDPDCYSIARDGSVWFSKTGAIYYEYSPLVLDVAQAITFQWKSIPIDISLLGEGIKDTERFYVSKLWIRYDSNYAITVNIYKEGSGTAYQSKAFSGGTNAYGVMKLKPGFNAKDFQIEFTGTSAALTNEYVGVRIKSIGIIYSPIKIGIWSESRYTALVPTPP